MNKEIQKITDIADEAERAAYDAIKTANTLAGLNSAYDALRELSKKLRELAAGERLKRFILVATGSDDEGPWAHQTLPGFFDNPDDALREFRKDWSKGTEFRLHELETGTYQIIRDGDDRVDGFIVPVR